VRKLEGRKMSAPNRLVAKVGAKGLVALFVVVLLTGLAAGVTLTPLQNTPMGGWSSAFSGTNVHVISMETSVIDASTWEVVVKVENTDVVGHTVELTLSAIDSGGSTIFTDTRTVVLTWTPIIETVTFILSAPDIVELTSKFALFLEQTV
ncbi:MAG: hypothetical protein V3U70_02275, partial [Thermoplasmata archaeon]